MEPRPRQARSVARDTATLVARDGLPVGQAVGVAQAALADAELANPAISVTTADGRVRVSITGDMPGYCAARRARSP